MSMDLHVEQGTLLAATPELLDPNFMHSVVLICQHTPEGAYGLVLNRRSEYTTRTLLSEHRTLGRYDHPIYVGGPVQLNSMQILHCVPEHIRDGVELVPGLWIGGELEHVAHYIAEHDASEDHVRLLVGYAGWGAGQLDAELAGGSWLPAPCTAEHVFRRDPENLWRDVMRTIRGELAGLENQPPDPEWN
ncbi:MAG: YqgE/AlgH family protein [Planctomycetes bacterium]|nr:YqgE/AlgH family protein [Planctomycetota bacterium]